jgi:hypothetical protein
VRGHLVSLLLGRLAVSSTCKKINVGKKQNFSRECELSWVKGLLGGMTTKLKVKDILFKVFDEVAV